jgi:hypothetical protein
MSNKSMQHNRKSAPKVDLTKLKRWFGAPPLLGNEGEKDFAEYVGMLAECMELDDQVVETLVYQYAIESYTYMRLVRYQAQAVRRRDKARDNFSEKHAGNKRRREGDKRINPEFVELIKEKNHPGITYEMLDDVSYDTCTRAIENARENDCVTAFESAIDLYEKIDQLISQCARRRNDALHQIEWYRVSLAERLRKKSEAARSALLNEEKSAGATLVPAEGTK